MAKQLLIVQIVQIVMKLQTSPDNIDTGVKGDDDTTEMSRILIAYFTRADNVKSIS